MDHPLPLIHRSSFCIHRFLLWVGLLLSKFHKTDGAYDMLKNKKLAVLGCGKLGEILIKGLLEAGVIEVANVIVTAGHQHRLEQMHERFGVAGTLSNEAAAESADIIILAVKPQTVPSVVTEISEVLRPTQV